MTTRRRLALITLLASVFAGAISAFIAIGGETRMPTVLVLYFSGFAGGAALTSFVWRSRGERSAFEAASSAVRPRA